MRAGGHHVSARHGRCRRAGSARRVLIPLWWLCGLLGVAVGCHREAPDGVTYFERKISIADRFYDVAALDTDRAIVVGYAGKILRTADGGRTWEVVPSGTSRALYSVVFTDGDHGWISGQDGLILHSTDGGQTWSSQDSGTNVYLFALDFVSEQEGWVVGDRATVLHTVDGGRTWRFGKVGSQEGLTADERLLAQDPVLYDVQFLDPQTGWIVGEFGNIYHTTDGGKSWGNQQETLLGDGIFDVLDIPTFFGVNFVDRMNGIAAALEGRIARTRDGGKTWKYETFDAQVPMVDPMFQPFQFPNTTAWAVGAAGQVGRQVSPEGPWEQASLGMEILTWLRGVDFVDDQNGWIVGGYGLILHTTDGGKTWLPAVG